MNPTETRLHPRLHPVTHDRMRDVMDAELAEEPEDLDCIGTLVAIAERSAQLVDDGMNATEASEERNAAAEGQAMR